MNIVGNIKVGGNYWVRLPHNMPNGMLHNVRVINMSTYTITLDLANCEAPFRNVNTYQFSSVDFIEEIL